MYDWQHLGTKSVPNTDDNHAQIKVLKKYKDDYVMMSMDDIIDAKDTLMAGLAKKGKKVKNISARVMSEGGKWLSITQENFKPTFLADYYVPYVKDSSAFDDAYQTVFHVLYS